MARPLCSMRCLGVALLALAVLACSPAAVPTATPLATPTPTATATPTAEPTVTPTSAPTPSPVATATPSPAATATPQAGLPRITMISVEGEYYEEFRYAPDILELKATDVIVLLFNTTDSAHDMWIATELGDNPLAQSPIAAPGAIIEFTIDGLAAGTYSFWCSIENHAELGMIGTLVISP